MRLRFLPAHHHTPSHTTPQLKRNNNQKPPTPTKQTTPPPKKPNKVRRVLDVIRGRSYEDAIVMMEYMPYRACEHIIKALKSVSSFL